METKLKIMYLNPVGFSAYDSFFGKMIRENKFPNSEVHVASLTADVGLMDNLEYRTYNGLIASELIKATRKASQEGFDAMVIGCFYDPFLLDAREISGDMVVVGPSHSSVEIALKLSNRFSVVIGQKKWEHEMHSTIKEYGYGEHLASFRDVNMNVCEFQKDHDITASKLFQASKSAVEEDFAESIILGCTCEFGFYQEIQKKLEVPVIDPSLAALKQAEQAAFLKKSYGWKPSRKWSCEPPSEQDISQFKLFDDAYEFGNRIIIE
ncbi:aspartate/glutamate racemase family protein [Galbibacter sp. PAP.153]|uniref:aspartate/glutamate racemase family protein n=1 Tax=Galbibacter sp. PAP.153 TaxID=3104623 RepID=UPI00300B2F9E